MQIFGFDIVNTLITAGVTGIALVALDKIIKIVIYKLYPEKLLIDLAKFVDDGYLDVLKKKYPESGIELEKRIATSLRAMADIIEDK
jgi:hypothetical protein